MAHEIKLPKTSGSSLIQFYTYVGETINGGSNFYFQIPISISGTYLLQYEANITNASAGLLTLDVTTELALNGTSVSGNVNGVHRITVDTTTGHFENLTMTHNAKIVASSGNTVGFIMSPVGDLNVANCSITLIKLI